jgi:hypothetical protein
MRNNNFDWRLYVFPLTGSTLFLWSNWKLAVGSTTQISEILILAISAISVFALVAALQSMCFIIWPTLVAPYLQTLKEKPRQTLFATLALFAALTLSGWCFTMIGDGVSETHCEPDPRSGVWCE